MHKVSFWKNSDKKVVKKFAGTKKSINFAAKFIKQEVRTWNKWWMYSHGGGTRDPDSREAL